MKIVLLYSSFILSILGFGACNIVNPSEQIPTYIIIDSVSLPPTLPEKHGSVSHKITDVWVYYNLQLLGAFELPAKVPIYANGRGQIQVVAGIWDNGLSGTRARYPFYTIDTFSFDASPTQNIYHIPTFYYRTADQPVIRYFVENFEQGNSFLRLFGDTTIVRTDNPADVFEGNWSGKIELSTSHPTGECITSQAFSLPPNRDAYLEMNYKSDVPFDIRTDIEYNGGNIKSDVMSFRDRTQWTKVYVRLGGFSSTYQNGKFKFFIKTKLGDGMTNAKLLMDNFKIIYFE